MFSERMIGLLEVLILPHPKHILDDILLHDLLHRHSMDRIHIIKIDVVNKRIPIKRIGKH